MPFDGWAMYKSHGLYKKSMADVGGTMCSPRPMCAANVRRLLVVVCRPMVKPQGQARLPLSDVKRTRPMLLDHTRHRLSDVNRPWSMQTSTTTIGWLMSHTSCHCWCCLPPAVWWYHLLEAHVPWIILSIIGKRCFLELHGPWKMLPDVSRYKYPKTDAHRPRAILQVNAHTPWLMHAGFCICCLCCTMSLGWCM